MPVAAYSSETRSPTTHSARSCTKAILMQRSRSSGGAAALGPKEEGSRNASSAMRCMWSATDSGAGTRRCTHPVRFSVWLKAAREKRHGR